MPQISAPPTALNAFASNSRPLAALKERANQASSSSSSTTTTTANTSSNASQGQFENTFAGNLGLGPSASSSSSEEDMMSALTSTSSSTSASASLLTQKVKFAEATDKMNGQTDIPDYENDDSSTTTSKATDNRYTLPSNDQVRSSSESTKNNGRKSKAESDMNALMHSSVLTYDPTPKSQLPNNQAALHSTGKKRTVTRKQKAKVKNGKVKAENYKAIRGNLKNRANYKQKLGY